MVDNGDTAIIMNARSGGKNPDIMLFDEPTSALDRESTKTFVEILRREKHDHIILVVSHDDELLNACDEVIRMDSSEGR